MSHSTTSGRPATILLADITISSLCANRGRVVVFGRAVRHHCPVGRTDGGAVSAPAITYRHPTSGRTRRQANSAQHTTRQLLDPPHTHTGQSVAPNPTPARLLPGTIASFSFALTAVSIKTGAVFLLFLLLLGRRGRGERTYRYVLLALSVT